MFDQAQIAAGLDGIRTACCTAATSIVIFSAGINDTKHFSPFQRLACARASEGLSQNRTRSMSGAKIVVALESRREQPRAETAS